MEDIEKLVKTTLGEVEKVLNTKTVVGEPIVVEGATLIPLISVGFGFGAGGAGGGGGRGESKQSGEGAGSGTGGGAGVKPVAMIIIDKNGARIEAIKGGMASAIEKLTDSVPDMVGKLADKWGERKKEEEK